MLWFALTAAFSLMGVGMAAWQGEMDIGGDLGTAHIGVEFTNFPGSSIASSPPGGWDDPPASASIYLKSDKELEIKINNAYPGLEADFWYEIKNTGSVPAKITKHGATSSCDQVSVEYSIDSSSIAVGDSTGGKLKVVVYVDVEPLSIYTFFVQFEFQPDT